MSLEFYKNRPLSLALILAILMVTPDSPPWIAVFSGIILIYKFFTERSKLPPLSRKITNTLSVLLLIEILVQYRSLFVQEASTTLLVGLTALKIMDYKSERDLRFLFLLGFILVSLKPLYNIDFYWMAPTMICFAGLWWALLDSLPSQTIKNKSRFLMQIFVSALPLTIVLFIVFPRFVVPWAQAQAQGSGQMGFSDELKPGQVAELVSRRSLVFRARFFDSIDMKTNALYWRGAALNQSKGLEWRVGNTGFSENPQTTNTSPFHYEILLEPSGQTYFFGLERTLAIESNSIVVRKSADAIYKTSSSITKPISYEGYSSPLGKHQDLPTQEHLETPKLPEKTKKWVEKVTSQFSSKTLRLNELKSLFSDGSFTYSLKPGSYDENDLDQFLFQRRKGFCEHFAGAYATLARALGIPSRVITGFQGGAYNAFGGFWRITTHDAHAWAEVFHDGSWDRIDPTSWVAPLRLEIGAEAFFELPEEEQHSWVPGQYRESKDSSWMRWLNFVENQVEFVNYKWTQFLLEFDRGSQSNLWREIKANWGWACLGLIVVLLVTVLTIKMLEPKPSQEEELARLFQDLFAWGDEHQLKKLTGETPFEFCSRLAQARPILQDYLTQLMARYSSSIYQGQGIELTDLKQLKRQWSEARKG